jgi:hypothetical protein
MRDGVWSSTVCFRHSMRSRLVETSSSSPTARVVDDPSRFFLVDATRAVVESNVIHGSQLPDRDSATEFRRLEDGRESRIIKRSLGSRPGWRESS